MFEFLPQQKRKIIVEHPELGQPFFAGIIGRTAFIENLRAFSKDLCSKKLNQERRFLTREILFAVRELQAYPSEKWIGEFVVFRDNISSEIENARRFFQSNFNLKIDSECFISREITSEQLTSLNVWRNQTFPPPGIEMMTSQLFYFKTYLAVSLWRQKEGSKLNYLMGKGIGVEIALRGNVLKRTKRPVRFSYRSHSDFELYGTTGNSPYSTEFRKVFGSQEYYPLSKTKGLEGIPSDLILRTAEIVDFGGIRIWIPELEILFLDKYMRSEGTPRPEGTDAELLAKQYVLNRKKALRYFDRFVVKYKLDYINKKAQDGIQEQLAAIKKIFLWMRSELHEDGLASTKEIVLKILHERVEPLLNSNTMYSGIRILYWVEILPAQISDEGDLTDPILIEKIKEKIREVKGSEIDKIRALRLHIGNLLS